MASSILFKIGVAAILVAVGVWIGWIVDKRKMAYFERAALIREARETIGTFDFENGNFGGTIIYSRLRPYLRPETIERVESEDAVYVGGERGNPVEKTFLLDDLATMEKDLL